MPEFLSTLLVIVIEDPSTLGVSSSYCSVYLVSY
nr:MAG TPA: hypothetical protein [Caudoviricetes sp.]